MLPERFLLSFISDRDRCSQKVSIEAFKKPTFDPKGSKRVAQNTDLQNNLKQYSILVVDDTKENLHLLFTMLGGREYSIRPTPSGHQALRVAKEDPPDLILLDIRMPEIDGYEVCRQLKSDKSTADIPVIFLSAMDAVQDKVKAFQAGGVDYITKPFQLEEVRMRVKTQLMARAAQQEIQKLNETLEARVRQRTIELEVANAERERAQAAVLQMTQQLLKQRSETIEQAYDAVHNGPLQELAVILRTFDPGHGDREGLRAKLQKINADLRGIYRSMREAAQDRSEVLYLEGDLSLDLSLPISELLRQVFEHTVERDFPGFADISFHIMPDFTPLENAPLALNQKRGLSLFLQEALCNIGKHALGTTWIDITCEYNAGQYALKIGDNGCGLAMGEQQSAQNCDRGDLQRNLQNKSLGQGTYQAESIARQFRGNFSRRANHPQGVICELRWPKREGEQ